MTTNTSTIGIDMAKDKFDVALYQDGQYQMATFANTAAGYNQLLKWLKKRHAQGSHACLEATGPYGEALAQALHGRDYPVSVVNPTRIKAYGASQLKRNKTDREDAKVIAHFCATQSPPLWSPPPPEVQALQALSHRLLTLKENRTAELNRRQAGLQSVVRQDIDAHIAFLEAQITAIEQRIDDLINRHPDLRRQRELLTSIPGIGDITAAHFMAEVPDVTRFDSVGQLAAYAGLSTRRHQSGSSVHRPGRLSKTGNRRLRAALYMPALSAKQHNPLIGALVVRLEQRGKRPMVIIGAVMRKLLHLAFGVLKSGRPFDPNFEALRSAST
jgi:transposase